MNLYFDIEANGLLLDATRVHCIFTGDIDTGELRGYFDGLPGCNRDGSLAEGIAYLQAADTLIGHNNIGYDNPLIKKLHKVDLYRGYPSTIDDILISRWLNPRLNPVKGTKAGPHAMESWGIRLGHAKVEHNEWEELTPEMLIRCRSDVELGLRIHTHLMIELAKYKADLSYPLNVEHEFAHLTCDTEEYGHPFEEDDAQALRLRCWTEMHELSCRILNNFSQAMKILEGKDKITGLRKWMSPIKKDLSPTTHAIKYWGDEVDIVAGPFCRVEFNQLNLDSDQQVKKALLSLGWQPDEWNRSKLTNEITSPILTESSYHTLPAGIGTDFALYLKVRDRYRIMTRLLSNCTKDESGVSRVRYSINTLGTAAHRVTHRVLVNIPSGDSFMAEEIRKLFIPWPGHKMVGTDLEGAHLHECAVWMNDADFLKALLEGDKSKGEDPHTKNANCMVVTRDQAKIIVYTFLNGGRAGRIKSQLGISKDKAQAAIDGLEIAMPKLSPLIGQMINYWKAHGYIQISTGARLYPRKSNECLSYALLGTEQAIMKRAAIIAFGWARIEDIQCRLLSMNHDEVQVSVPDTDVNRWEQFIGGAIAIASKEVGIIPEMKSESKVGGNWMQTH